MTFSHNFDMGRFLFVGLTEEDEMVGIFVQDIPAILGPLTLTERYLDGRFRYSLIEMAPRQELLYRAVLAAQDPNTLLDRLIKQDLISPQTVNAILKSTAYRHEHSCT